VGQYSRRGRAKTSSTSREARKQALVPNYFGMTLFLVCGTYLRTTTYVVAGPTCKHEGYGHHWLERPHDDSVPRLTIVLHRPTPSGFLTDERMLGSPPAPKYRKEGTPRRGEESASTGRRCAPSSSSSSPSPSRRSRPRFRR